MIQPVWPVQLSMLGHSSRRHTLNTRVAETMFTFSFNFLISNHQSFLNTRAYFVPSLDPRLLLELNCCWILWGWEHQPPTAAKWPNQLTVTLRNINRPFFFQSTENLWASTSWSYFYHAVLLNTMECAKTEENWLEFTISFLFDYKQHFLKKNKLVLTIVPFFSYFYLAKSLFPRWVGEMVEIWGRILQNNVLSKGLLSSHLTISLILKQWLLGCPVIN